MGSCVSAEEARERIGAALDAIDAAHAVLRDTDSDVVGNNFRVDVAERLETQDGVRSIDRIESSTDPLSRFLSTDARTHATTL